MAAATAPVARVGTLASAGRAFGVTVKPLHGSCAEPDGETRSNKPFCISWKVSAPLVAREVVAGRGSLPRVRRFAVV